MSLRRTDLPQTSSADSFARSTARDEVRRVPASVEMAVGETERRRYGVIVAATIVGLALLFALAPSRFRFWYDSWTYYELARSIGHDFYRVATIREFRTGSSYSSAFPPLWPAIVATFARLGLGMLGSYVASFASFAAFAVCAERLARRLMMPMGSGLLSALLLLAFPGMRWDLAGGGSVALFLCMVALLGTLFVRLDPRSYRDAVAVGALAGAMVMLRFDSAPASVVALVAAVVLGVRGRRLVAMVATFALVLSPWVAYSVAHFHAPFVTDNRDVALALDPDAYVMDFLPRAQRTLHDDPVAWLAKLVVHLPVIVRAMLDAMVRSVFLIPVLLIAVATLFLSARHANGDDDGSRHVASNVMRSRGWIALLCVAFAPLAAYVITGYQESRYFSAFVWLVELMALGIALERMSPRVRMLATIALCVAGIGKSATLARYTGGASPVAVMRAQLSTTDVDALTGCLRRARVDSNAGVLFRTNVDLLNGYRFGALTGWRASPPPRNWETLTPAERGEFVRKFGLHYVLDTLPSGADRLPTEAVAGCPASMRRLVMSGT